MVSLCYQSDSDSNRDQPSLVMNDMNSLTHSCMHSFASFAIFAFSGRAVFIILATGAKFLMLESGYASSFPGFWTRGASGEGEDERWDMIGGVTTVAQPDLKGSPSSSMTGQFVQRARVRDTMLEAIPLTRSFNTRRIIVRANQREVIKD